MHYGISLYSNEVRAVQNTRLVGRNDYIARITDVSY